MVDTQKPIANARQLTIFIILTAYLIITNSDIFTGYWKLLNIIITIPCFIAVMLLKKEEGIPQLTDLFKSIITIFTSPSTNDEKIQRLESVLVLVSQQLGALYEEELCKITDYLKGVKSDGVVTNEEIEALKQKIAALEADLNK